MVAREGQLSTLPTGTDFWGNIPPSQCTGHIKIQFNRSSRSSRQQPFQRSFGSFLLILDTLFNSVSRPLIPWRERQGRGSRRIQQPGIPLARGIKSVFSARTPFNSEAADYRKDPTLMPTTGMSIDVSLAAE
jgi:hypothetical protein